MGGGAPESPTSISRVSKVDSLVLLELLHVLLEVEFSDVVLDERLLELDARDLDFGLLWDEIHLSFSFLRDKNKSRRLRQSNQMDVPLLGA